MLIVKMVPKAHYLASSKGLLDPPHRIPSYS